jgi:hypothetical protein
MDTRLKNLLSLPYAASQEAVHLTTLGQSLSLSLSLSLSFSLSFSLW